jgi:hypothetical protein
MGKTEWADGVLPHGEIEQLAPNLWIVSGTLKGMPLKRNMVVWRQADGTLVLHSVVALNDDGMKKLEALGKPVVMIVPNQGHRTDAARYKARFPGIVVVAPSGARKKVEEIVAVEKLSEEALPPLGVTVHKPGGFEHELIYEVKLEGGGVALVFNDILGHAEALPGVQGKVFGLLGVPGGGVGLPRIVRFFFLKDKKAYREWLTKAADEIKDIRVITVSHGPPVKGDGNAALRQAGERV